MDSGSDLNADAQVETLSACCSPPAATSDTGLPMADEGGTGTSGAAVHTDLADLLRRYDVNEYAASVRVYAVKGRGNA